MEASAFPVVFGDGGETSRAGTHASSPPPSLCGDQVGDSMAWVSRRRVRGGLRRGTMRREVVASMATETCTSQPQFGGAISTTFLVWF
jgi:hypothetical protein